MKKKYTLYHGSDHVIEKPERALGKKTNDFGAGFYLTEKSDLAAEWAASGKGQKVVSNEYFINFGNLSLLDLTAENYSILNWLAILVNHRTFALDNASAIQAKGYLIKHFSVDVNAYDVVKGYRADGSFLTFAEEFINGKITLGMLKKAVTLGKSGAEYCVMSEKAFSELKYVSSSEQPYAPAFAGYLNRDMQAKKDFLKLKQNFVKEDDLTMTDIIKGGIVNGDPRL